MTSRPDASAKLKAAAPKQGPNRILIGGVVAAVAILGIVLAVILGSSSGGSGGASSASALPQGATGTGGGIVANASTAKAGAPTLDLYEDFQCPVCGKLEQVFGQQIASMAKAGDIKLVVHMMSFLDAKLGNDSSVRAAAAAACAADQGKFLDYHGVVYANQPAQEGAGYTDADLMGFASKAGISGSALTSWTKCFDAKTHMGYAKDVETAAEKAGVFSTPTLKLNGKDLPLQQLSQQYLTDQVKAATK
ncbi:DsbA family protein [Oryzihumus sp.]|jgi:protein-disulfide isomerase|uniref:DsbA family protein n=1 Tax=Oryzihumus sp. TaxID=1968903 RepID=UPI002EDA1478